MYLRYPKDISEIYCHTLENSSQNNVHFFFNQQWPVLRLRDDMKRIQQDF